MIGLDLPIGRGVPGIPPTPPGSVKDYFHPASVIARTVPAGRGQGMAHKRGDRVAAPRPQGERIDRRLVERYTETRTCIRRTQALSAKPSTRYLLGAEEKNSSATSPLSRCPTISIVARALSIIPGSYWQNSPLRRYAVTSRSHVRTLASRRGNSGSCPVRGPLQTEGG